MYQSAGGIFIFKTNSVTSIQTKALAWKQHLFVFIKRIKSVMFYRVAEFNLVMVLGKI